MTRKQVVDVDALLVLNPEYAQALWRGEQWALDHMRLCESLNAGEPEGFRRPFDGKPRKWCGGACPHDEGCVTCTLPDDPEMARLNRKHRAEGGSDEDLARKGIIKVRGHVDDQMVARVRKSLDIALATRPKRNELEIHIESSGGEVPAGMQVFDMIHDAPVKMRIGKVRWHALSMGLIILQACDRRIAAPDAQLLLHHARFKEVTLPVLRDPFRVGLMLLASEDNEKREEGILMRRTGRTLDEINDHCDRDKTISSQEALDFGLIDAIED